jgi:hypothetical protein
MRLGAPYVTGRAYRATGFPVVNVEFALQRGQLPSICHLGSGSFGSKMPKLVCLLAAALMLVRTRRAERH